MEIAAVLSKPNTASQAESRPAAQSVNGMDFLGSVAQAVKAGKIVMPGDEGMQKMDFSKAKFLNDDLRIEGTEEDLLYGFLNKIKRILKNKSGS